MLKISKMEDSVCPPVGTAEREDDMRRSMLLVLIAFLCTLVPGPVMATDNDPPRIMPAEVMKRLNSGEEIVFLDTRTDLARATIKSKIPDAIQITTAEVLSQVIRETPKESLVVTYCT